MNWTITLGLDAPTGTLLSGLSTKLDQVLANQAKITASLSDVLFGPPNLGSADHQRRTAGTEPRKKAGGMENCGIYLH